MASETRDKLPHKPVDVSLSSLSPYSDYLWKTPSKRTELEATERVSTVNAFKIPERVCKNREEFAVELDSSSDDSS